jgi:hypothetical protein
MNLNLSEQYLSKKYPYESLKTLLLPRSQWKPFPTAADRAGWNALPDSLLHAHVEMAEDSLKVEWPHLWANVYQQFSINGNRTNYEKPYFRRRELLANLVTGECVENQGRFMPAIANYLWSIMEESSWCIPAHIGVQKQGSGLPDTTEPIVDLFCAETGALLAWTAYLLGPQLDAVSPLIMPRLAREIDQRILTPNLVRNDFWWMGFTPRRVNNWNPWINSNWLTCALLIEPDEDRRARAVAKILQSLDRFLVPYPKDGGCDEGPGYWGRAGASLFDNLELLLSASGGKIDEYGNPLVKEIGRFIYRAHINDDFYLNFADAAAVLTPEAMLVFNYGKRIGDSKMMSFGAWLAEQRDLLGKGYRSGKSGRSSLGRELPAIFSVRELEGVLAKPALLRDAWLPEIQVMVARDSDGSNQGFYLAAKGGHNEESHNHNDVGHFVMYIDGKPVIVDAGVETYTRKTFSDQRYQIWTMQSAYHSLPTINGVMQAPGREFAARSAAYKADEKSAVFSLDISGAYPAEAGLKTWQRQLTLERGKSVKLVDSYEMTAPARELTLSLLTACKADVSLPGKVTLSPAPLAEEMVAGSATVLYDAKKFKVAAEVVQISDERLGAIWGKQLTRLLFTALTPQSKDTWEFTITK